MSAQANLEQHPGTLDRQRDWGTEGKKGFAADNSTRVSLRRSHLLYIRVSLDLNLDVYFNAT